MNKKNIDFWCQTNPLTQHCTSNQSRNQSNSLPVIAAETKTTHLLQAQLINGKVALFDKCRAEGRVFKTAQTQTEMSVTICIYKLQQIRKSQYSEITRSLAITLRI